jgi:hypothetical protein
MPLLLDFDELLLKVRSPGPRAHIADAVAAFRAGALRPAVVAAWTAVVFDIMAKIREIELTGDARAKQQVERFDAIRTANDVDGSLAMERAILDVARDQFELLTPHEYTDLVRLREDRHRCAHPAMNTAEEAYQPSAELVRYHIGSALTHLLVQAPVQGKAAMTRLMAEVTSLLFPVDVAGATRVLSGGPLQRPKDVLVRDFVLATVKATLRGEHADDDGFGKRALAAVAAVSQMHASLVDQVYSVDLPRLLAGLDDGDVWRVLRLCVALPALEGRVPAAVRIKLERLVEVFGVAQWPHLFLLALRMPMLRDAAESRAARLERDDIGAVFRHDVDTASTSRPLVARAVDLLVSSPSWNSTNSLIAEVLMPAVSFLSEADVEQIAHAADENVEVRNAHGTPGLLLSLRDRGTVSIDRFLDIAFSNNLAMKFPSLIEGVAEPLLVAARGTAHDIGIGHRIRHPTLGEGVVRSVTGSGDGAAVLADFDDPLFANRQSLLRALVRLDEVR